MKTKCLISGVLFFLIAFSPLIAGCQKDETAEKIIRLKPNVAGEFYSADKDKLRAEIEKYISGAKYENPGRVRAIIAPHAGYVYSGPTAGYAYSTLKDTDFNTAFVLGPSHHAYFEGISIPKCNTVVTPLGDIPMSSIAEKLMKESIFVSKEEAHSKEHSTEVHMPFLQATLKEFSVVPMVTGEVESAEAAGIIAKYLDDKTLIVVSSDLCHYLDYETTQGIDKATVRMILGMRTDLLELPNFQACGKAPILILLEIAKANGWVPKLLDLRNSGDTAGNKDQVVGYAAIVFVDADEKNPKPVIEKEIELSKKDGEYLTKLSRRAIYNFFDSGTGDLMYIEEKEVPEACRTMRGCFVTLTKNGQLRGCIGSLIPDKKLYENVIENAVNAANKDPRFVPVTREEMEKTHIEVSVLSLPRKLTYKDDKELLEKLRPKIDGVILTFADRIQSTYLPQVWEQIPNKKMFLETLTKKASPRLPEDAWKEKFTKVFTYQAQVFEEKEEKEKQPKDKEKNNAKSEKDGK